MVDIFTANHYITGAPLNGIGFITKNLYPLLDKYKIKYEKKTYSEEDIFKDQLAMVYREALNLLISDTACTSFDLAKERGWTEKTCRQLGIATVADFETFVQQLSGRTGLPKDALVTQYGIWPRIFAKNKITFTICTAAGQPSHFWARNVDWKKGKGQKYDSSPANCRLDQDALFGLHLAKRYISQRLDIFEGHPDVATAMQAGLNCCCALGGLNFTPGHVEMIKELGFTSVCFVLDQDSPGRTKMKSMLAQFGTATNIEVSVLHLKLSKEEAANSRTNDPDYFIQKYGLEAYRRLEPKKAFDYRLEEYTNSQGAQTQAQFLQSVMPLLLGTANRIERGRMIKKLARTTGIEVDDIKDEVERLERADVSNLVYRLSKDLYSVRDAEELSALISDVQAKLSSTAIGREERKKLSVAECMENYRHILESLRTRSTGIHGWTTGFEFFDKYVDGIPKPTNGGSLLALAGSPHVGKLIAHSTPVLTPNGFVQHGDLRPGDYVYGPDGKPKKVLAIGNDDFATKKVVFKDGSEILTHPNHEWVVYDSHNRRRIRTTAEIEASGIRLGPIGRGGHYTYRVEYTKPIEFEERRLPIHPYVLGIWLGDGAASKPQITQSPEDSACKEQIKKLGYKITGEWVHRTTGCITYSLGPKFGALLDQLNLRNNKHIPAEYIFSSYDQRLQLLAGLLDSDGYINPKNDRIGIGTIFGQLADDIVLLLNSLGINAPVFTYPPAKGGLVNGHQIAGRRPVCVISFNSPFSIPTVLERKKVEGRLTPRKRSIVAIEDVAPVPGRCIQVEGGVYLVGKHLVPTHNSALLLAIAYNVARLNRDVTVLYWAIDDARKDIYPRLLAALTGVSIAKIGRIVPFVGDEEKRVTAAEEELARLIEEGMFQVKDDEVGRQRALASKWIQDSWTRYERPILLAIDSFHNIIFGGKAESDERVKAKALSVWLKSASRKENFTVICTMELNKSGFERPTLASINETGKVVYDWDFIGFVNNRFLATRSPDDPHWVKGTQLMPIIELDIQKNKLGRRGSLWYQLDEDTTGLVEVDPAKMGTGIRDYAEEVERRYNRTLGKDKGEDLFT